MTGEIKDPEIGKKLDRLENRVGEGDKQISPNTLRRYEADLEWLDQVLDDMDISATEVGVPEIDSILTKLTTDYNGTTVSNRWTVLKEFYQSIERKRIIDENPFERVTKKEYGIAHGPEQSKHFESDDDLDIYAPSEDEIDLMVKNVNSNQDRLRDQLLILLMYHTACRCDEIRKVKLQNIDREKRQIHLPKEIVKYDKSRTVRYGESLDDLMYKWIDGGLRDRRKFSDSPYLFISQHSEQMSKSMVNEIVREAAINAGINEVLYTDAAGNDRWKITSHSLRHSCATKMKDEGADIYRLSEYLGHSSVEITEDVYVSSKDDDGVDEAHEYGPQ